MSIPFTPISIASISNGARFILHTLYPLAPPTSIRDRTSFQFPLYPFKLSVTATSFNNPGSFWEGADEFDWGDSYEDGTLAEEDEGSPWEGAVLYKRSSSVTHIEHCTTLERLGLGKISSMLSRSTAAAMGLRLTNAVKEFRDGTPVLVSIDVTSKTRDVIRLDGLVKTVISLGCNRCGEPAAESVFSNFSLLLTDKPVDPAEVINFEVIYGEDKRNPAAMNVDEGDDSLIELDDRLYFPPEDKEIDISKQIRDLLHIEITMNAVCDSNCKGICLKCGINLNTDGCNCANEVSDVVSRPLGNLRKQMQQK